MEYLVSIFNRQSYEGKGIIKKDFKNKQEAEHFLSNKESVNEE